MASVGFFSSNDSPVPVVPSAPAQLSGSEPSGIFSPSPASGAARASLLDPRQMSDRIDELVEARLRAAGVPPAPVADDYEFFRRLCLDLTGRIPSVAELRDFLDDD